MLELITLRIGGRKTYQVNFADTKDTPDTNADSICNFILPYLDGGVVNILHLYSPAPNVMREMSREQQKDLSDDENYCPILFQNKVCETAIFLRKITIDDSHDIKFDLTTKVERYAGIENGIEEDYSFRLVHIHDSITNYWRLSCKKHKFNSIENFRVALKLELPDNNSTEVTHYIQVTFAPQTQIRDIVLDFGSEASQIATFKRQMGQTVGDIQEILPSMASLLRNGEENDWIQKSNVPTLFKSIFYGQTNISNEQLKQLDASAKCTNDSELIMLTTEKEAQSLTKESEKKYIVLPTVKLSGYGGIPQPKILGCGILNFNDFYFYRKTILNLFLSEILMLHKQSIDNTPIAVNFCLLVPNVFNIKQVCDIVHKLQANLHKMLHKEKLEDFVKAIEVNAISESDASLIGTIETMNSKQKGNEDNKQVLVLDAGKGTLDISVIKYINDRYICKYRAGILGAGNSITYAYMCALIYDYLYIQKNKKGENANITDEEITKYINTNICQSNEHFLVNKIFNAVEKYKIIVNTYDRMNPQQPEVKEGNEELKKFEQFVIDMCEETSLLSTTAQGRINEVLKVIADEVVDKLQIIHSEDFDKIDYLYYTGRAVRCKKLKETVTAALEKDKILSTTECKIIGERNIYADINNNDKQSCLYIRYAVNRGACSDNTFCMPFISHISKSYEPQGVEILSRITDWWNMIVKKDKKDEIFTSIKSSPIVTSRYHITSVDENELYDMGMRHGFKITFNSNRDKLFNNGFYYRVSAENNIQGDMRLFIIDGKMFLRLNNTAAKRTNNDTCFSLEYDYINRESSPLTFSTFFPNVKNVEDDSIILIKSQNNDIETITHTVTAATSKTPLDNNYVEAEDDVFQ